MVIGGGLGTLALVVLALFFGVDPGSIVNPGGDDGAGPASQGQPYQEGADEAELRKFSSVVLASTEDVWKDVLPQQTGKQYRNPTMVLFSGRVSSACGMASAAVGPFYCPGDEKLYLDLSFFDELRTRFHSPGDFADAYVIAHEVGHHVQKQLGLTDRVDAARGRMSKEEANRMSVKLELQADFLAGVWAHYAQQTKGILEPGDIEEAIKAASEIGDDKLQQENQGYVVPDSFTHGTSAQRVQWFRRGYETGDIRQGDTFSAPDL